MKTSAVTFGDSNLCLGGQHYLFENIRATIKSRSYALENPHPLLEIIKYTAEIQNYNLEISNTIFQPPTDRFEIPHAPLGYRQHF